MLDSCITTVAIAKSPFTEAGEQWLVSDNEAENIYPDTFTTKASINALYMAKNHAAMVSMFIM